MRDYKQTVVTTTPGRAEIDGPTPHFVIPPKEDMATIVRADNSSIRKNEIIVIGVVIFIMSVSVTIVMYLVIAYLLEVAAGARAGAISGMVGVSLLLLLGKYSLPYITGDNVAEREIKESYRTERDRVEATAELGMAWVSLETDRESNRHVEAMQHLRNEQVAMDLGHRMAAVEDSQRRLLDLTEIQANVPRPARESTFVPSRLRPARQAARSFVESLYDSDGKPDAGRVHENGSLKIAAPWKAKGGEWNGEEWGANAKRLLMDGWQDMQPLIVPVMSGGKPRGYRLNVDHYPTRADVTRYFATLPEGEG